MASQTGLRVATSNSCKGPVLLEKDQTKILGPESVILDQISEIWPQKAQPGNPAFKPNCFKNFWNHKDRFGFERTAETKYQR